MPEPDSRIIVTAQAGVSVVEFADQKMLDQARIAGIGEELLDLA